MTTRILSCEYAAIDKIDSDSWDPRESPKNEKQKTIVHEEYQILLRSIESVGIRNPISVIQDEKKFVAIDGRRRLRAAKEIGFREVPIVRNNDLTSEAQRRLIAGLANYARSKGEDHGRARWVCSVFEAQGYDMEQAALNVKKIDNWFSQEKGRTWDDLIEYGTSSVLRQAGGSKTDPILLNKDFLTICRMIPYSPKYQYQLMSTQYKLSNEVLKKAERKGLSSNKQISLTTGPLPEHPEIQKELIDEIADMPKDRATKRVQDVASDLASGRLKKEGKRYTHDYKVKKEDGKILPPLNVRILDINASINKFLFNMTQRAITKGEHEFSEKTIENTKAYRIEILKTLDERNLINLERGLRFVQTVTDEMLELIEKEYESTKMKEKMSGK